MPVRLVTVIPPAGWAGWEAATGGPFSFFLSQELVQFLPGWKSVSEKLHKGRNRTEPPRR